MLSGSLVPGFCGTLAGCDDFVETVDWAADHAEFFGTFLELPNGIPSHDTFNRVFASVKPAAFQAVLPPWLLERRRLPGDWIHLDGKAMRQTRRDSIGLAALHVVSAWAGQTGLTLGQVAVGGKSNETKAMRQLLQLLDLRQTVAATDAMGRQTEIAQAIVAQEGGHILAAKDNQPNLFAEVQAAFAAAEVRPASARRNYTTEDQGHGRHEGRTVQVLPAAE